MYFHRIYQLSNVLAQDQAHISAIPWCDWLGYPNAGVNDKLPRVLSALYQIRRSPYKFAQAHGRQRTPQDAQLEYQRPPGEQEHTYLHGVEKQQSPNG